MNGVEFREFLYSYFTEAGQPLYGNIIFSGWNSKGPDKTSGFRFRVPGHKSRVIPANILMAAWDANSEISNAWLKQKFRRYFNDAQKLEVLNFLVGHQHN